MKTKRFDKLLQIRLSNAQELALSETSKETGITRSELARMSLRVGLRELRDKLHAVEVANEQT